jgi:two-component system chemotaxis sensor kinase CheA
MKSIAMTIDMSQFLSLYFEECQTNVFILQDSLHGLMVSREAVADLGLAVRAVHSIKSASAAFGFDELSDLSQAIEDVLRQVERGVSALTVAHVSQCLEASSVLCELLRRRSLGERADAQWAAGQIAALEACYAKSSRAVACNFMNGQCQ